MSRAVTGEGRMMSDSEKPESMFDVVKWFFVRPTGYWTPAWSLFFVSWSLMTQLPFALFWGNLKIGDKPVFEADTNLYWTVFLTFEFGWLVVSNFILATFLHAAKLSGRVEKLERQLQAMGGRETVTVAAAHSLGD
jgi:hypothetical protein